MVILQSDKGLTLMDSSLSSNLYCGFQPQVKFYWPLLSPCWTNLELLTGQPIHDSRTCWQGSTCHSNKLLTLHVMYLAMALSHGKDGATVLSVGIESFCYESITRHRTAENCLTCLYPHRYMVQGACHGGCDPGLSCVVLLGLQARKHQV